MDIRKKSAFASAPMIEFLFLSNNESTKIINLQLAIRFWLNLPSKTNSLFFLGDS
jgi:hypothetical protein